MNIYIGADHRGFAMKEGLLPWLREQGHVVHDMGAQEFTEGDDYPDYAMEVAQAVATDTENNRGVLLCGSGIGMAITANKITGIRAGSIQAVDIVKSARNDDDINILSLGADFMNLEDAKAVIATFLQTPFSGQERHVRRVGKITEMEK